MQKKYCTNNSTQTALQILDQCKVQIKYHILKPCNHTMVNRERTGQLHATQIAVLQTCLKLRDCPIAHKNFQKMELRKFSKIWRCLFE